MQKIKAYFINLSLHQAGIAPFEFLRFALRCLCYNFGSIFNLLSSPYSGENTMTLTVTLRTEDGQVSAFVGEQKLAGPTPLDSLLQQEDLHHLRNVPYEQGERLLAALGGDALIQALGQEETLLLASEDPEADQIPWEFAALPGRRLLAAEVGLLRLVAGQAPPPPEQANRLQWLALFADPLVDDDGQARERRLDQATEMRAVRRTLRESGVAVQARRIPGTSKQLRRTLRRERNPVLLHVSCHGSVVETPEGPLAVLLLEDRDGKEKRLSGRDLISRMAPAGVLRLILLSACLTSAGTDEARLARALALNGVPAAIGMQGKFPDSQSEPLAAAIYEALLAGYGLAEALRQARQDLLDSPSPYAAGLPVAYVARSGWTPLPLPPGQPQVDSFVCLGRVQLPEEVQPPRPLLGRYADLHKVARLYSRGARVVTISGSGGMGKTALAAAFAERFCWRWVDGVRAYSFASGEVDLADFQDTLLRTLLGLRFGQTEIPEDLAAQREMILNACPDWDGLLLLDNYETILQQCSSSAGEGRGEEAAAERVHRLVFQLAEGGARLLLTSREQPAGLRGERLYPPKKGLPGLPPLPAAALFWGHSTRAKSEGERGQALALAVAEAAEGHPLAITLLAGEYDQSAVRPEVFLDNWSAELIEAEERGLAGHHKTFVTAFKRSFDALSPRQQDQL